MEVIASLRFNTPCLGNVRRPDRDLMERDPDGMVIFMPTWWRFAFRDAARMLNRFQKQVDCIKPALAVEGEVKVFSRQFGERPEDYKEHEAFIAGDTLVCRFMLDGIKLGSFRELLETVGKYQGMSPYGFKDGFGRFSVMEVRRAGNRNEES
jgi:hypothetical protein